MKSIFALSILITLFAVIQNVYPPIQNFLYTNESINLLYVTFASFAFYLALTYSFKLKVLNELFLNYDNAPFLVKVLRYSTLLLIIAPILLLIIVLYMHYFTSYSSSDVLVRYIAIGYYAHGIIKHYLNSQNKSN
ncbi:hypothetical protein [Poseidonibacter ostreae]|uniref:Uncharacterized protein n=1 Tax=Poseidonibacter ostreae TaxID=2654171 RepID=A0A6L4WY05_9BACT|nr:hypothetical protein [Poseidonibacter ostreae]KAB7891340.1 hypothetical protein GBG19_00455 [Poseidonibacter ostreae]